MKTLASKCLTGLMLCASTYPLTAYAQSAPEQDPKPIVIFGDSLSDTGNAFRLTGGTFPDPNFYNEGRLSNGPIWADLAAPNQGYYADLLTGGSVTGPIDGWNFAVAGARSGNDELDPNTLTPPGLLTQVRDYRLLVSAGVIAPEQRAAAAAIWAGGNDYGIYVTDPSRDGSLDEAFVNMVVGNLATATTDLVEAGVEKVLLLNLFDFSAAPTSSFFPDEIRDAGDALISAHNVSLVRSAEELNGVNGGRVLVVDVNSLIRDIIDNPALYGFTHVAEPCLPDNAPPQCASDAEADGRLFWDGTHLSRAGHARIYEVVRATELAADHAPRLAGAVADAGLLLADRQYAATEHHFTNAVARRPGSKVAISMWGADGRVERDAVSGVSAYDVDSQSYGGGVDVQLAPGLRVGLVASRTKGDANAAEGIGSFTGDSNAASLIASWTRGNLRAEFQLGRAWQDFAIVRQSGLSVAPEGRSKTEGTATLADARLQWSLDFGAVRVEPRAGLRFAQLELDGWQEEGARFMNVAVEAQERESLLGRIGAAASFEVPIGGVTLRPYIGADYSRELLDGEWVVRTQLGSGQHLVDTADSGDRNWVDVQAGANLELTEALSVTAAYESRLFSEGDERRSYAVGLNFRF